MKTSLLTLKCGIILLLAIQARPLLAQGTAFNYQGHLTDNGVAATGNYDIQFHLLDAATGGNFLATNAVAAVVVTNGVFIALLDFGAGAFTGPPRWLELLVRTNGSSGAFSVLTPRQFISPTPYAFFAGSVANGAIGNGQLAANAILTANLSNNTVTAAKIASGQVVKSLNGLTDNVTLAPGANVTLAASPTNGNILVISSTGAGGGAFSLNGTNAFYNAGNVGIGLNTPNEPFEVGGVGRAFFGNGGGTSRKGLLLDGVNDGTYARIESYAYGTGLGLPLALNSVGGGNVGIGIINPSAAFQVNRGNRIVAINPPGLNNGGEIDFSRPDDGSLRYRIGGSAAPNDDFVLYAEGGGEEMRFVSGGGGTTGFGFYLNTSLSSAFASTRPAPAVKIDGSGNLGIGTAAPTAPLTIGSAGQAYADFISSNTLNGSVLELINTTPYGPDQPIPSLGAINFGDGNSVPCQISANPSTIFFRVNGVANAIGFDYNGYTLFVNGTAHRADNSSTWTTTSDRRLKHDIADLQVSLEVLDRVRPVRFKYNEDYLRSHPGSSGKESFGVVAQEFKEVFPDYVTTDKDGFLGVDLSPLIPYNTAAVRELHKRVEVESAQIAALEKANARMQTELAAQKDLTTRVLAEVAALQKTVGRLAEKSSKTYALKSQQEKNQ